MAGLGLAGFGLTFGWLLGLMSGGDRRSLSRPGPLVLAALIPVLVNHVPGPYWVVGFSAAGMVAHSVWQFVLRRNRGA
ncbi:hypothetical protein [Actinocrispum wychmicini]|uniref:Uncharacterized protein n=1 Tax=Actinocrispum wychmicini TaxID=1213861 RepID=A0A4R2JB45_9PSEU|nr:hypothetical protein [Actinocrispum wychmicini]TCO56044.1 hypothetical protein EV192_107469 [Actinocrispum wychmicini]